MQPISPHQALPPPGHSRLPRGARMLGLVVSTVVSEAGSPGLEAGTIGSGVGASGSEAGSTGSEAEAAG